MLMYTPHTVTIYNFSRETDPATFEEITRSYITILRGVFLDESKAANVNKSGLVGADAISLYIPFSVKALDGVTGAEKQYTGPMEFWAAADKTGLWTLSTDRNTMIVRGEVVEQDKTPEFLELAHDGVYTVTKVDAKDYGSPMMWHWECGGV